MQKYEVPHENVYGSNRKEDVNTNSKMRRIELMKNMK
jgi:hypothetical protein